MKKKRTLQFHKGKFWRLPTDLDLIACQPSAIATILRLQVDYNTDAVALLIIISTLMWCCPMGNC